MDSHNVTNPILKLQVQFRLKQIVDASPGEKEELLQQLEEFANRGIPDLREAAVVSRSNSRVAEDGQVGESEQFRLL